MNKVQKAWLIAKQKSSAIAAGVGTMVVSGAALATGDSIADPVVTAVNAAAGSVALIGAAVLLVIVAIRAYHWARRAL